METVFSLVFIIGCIGTWYFIKRNPNKRNRNISIALIALAVVIIGVIPSGDKSDDASKPSEEKKVESQSNSDKVDLVLEVPKEVTSDDSGEVKISGKTSPNAEVSIGMGIVGDKTTADKSGDFILLYDLDRQQADLTINCKLDGSTKSTKIKVRLNDIALIALEEKEAEDSRKSESRDQEKKKVEESKETEQNITEESKNEEQQNNYTSVNEEIKAHLEDNQGWAMGTIDRNGNPISNGEPSPEYANWIYVRSVEYNGSDIEVQVTADFKNLSENEKNSIASSCQGMTVSYANLSERPAVYVYNGENSYGGSKLLSTNKFTWYK